MSECSHVEEYMKDNHWKEVYHLKSWRRFNSVSECLISAGSYCYIPTIKLIAFPQNIKILDTYYYKNKQGLWQMKETIPQCTCTSKYYNEHAFKLFKYTFKRPFVHTFHYILCHPYLPTNHTHAQRHIIHHYKSRLMNQQKTKMQLLKSQSKRGMIVCIFKSSTCLRQEDYPEYEASLD